MRTFGTGVHPNPDFTLIVHRCPSCNELSILVLPYDIDRKQYRVWARPNAVYKKFPDYVPEQIREDYEEACSILHLSPKASATLSRRCLQGMIRDSWANITPGRLVDEIQQLQGKIPSSQWEAIDALRSLGNIGAHMEKDVNLIVDIDEDEANKLISLIEILIENWYVAKHKDQELYEKIKTIGQEKQTQRKKK